MLASPIAVGDSYPRQRERAQRWHTKRMTVQVPTRMRADEVEVLDRLVRDGLGDSRSDVIRLALAQLAETHRRRKIGQQIVSAYRDQPQSDDDEAWALANALAMTEAEPW